MCFPSPAGSSSPSSVGWNSIVTAGVAAIIIHRIVFADTFRGTLRRSMSLGSEEESETLTRLMGILFHRV